MNILVIHENILRPDRSGCEQRLFDFVRLLLKLGHSVTFMARLPNAEPAYFSALTSMGVSVYVGTGVNADEVFHGWFGPPHYRFQQILRNGFDLAILMLWFWHYITIPDDCLDQIRIHSPNTVIAVMTDDRHADRHLQIAKRTRATLDIELAIEFAHREALIYNKADMVITISTAERDHIRRLTAGTPVYIAPFSVKTRPRRTDFTECSGLLFLGDFCNSAVLDSAQWLVDLVWPLVIRECRELELTLAGSNSEFFPLRGHNIYCAGHVTDLGATFDHYRFLVSPVLYGTGIVTKNIISMANELPVITTPLGLQTLDNSEELAIVAEDDPQRFSEVILGHYSNRTEWYRLSRNAFRYVQRYFALSLAESGVKDILSAISSRSRTKSSARTQDDYEDTPAMEMYPFRGGSGERQLMFARELMICRRFSNALTQLRYALFCAFEFRADNELVREILVTLDTCKRQHCDGHDR